MAQSDELHSPFIENEWLKYKKAVTDGGKINLDAIQEFGIRQAHFAGFAQSCKIMDADFEGDDREVFLVEVKEEIKHFSAASRKLGKEIGVGHVRMM